MNSSFQFKSLNRASKDDVDKYVKLHNKLFPITRISDEWLHWYFNLVECNNDRYTTTRIHGAFDGDRLIGIWCVEPRRFKTKDQTLNVGRCFSVGIDQDYRRKNLFTELSNFAIETEKKLGYYHYIFGFPQTGRPVVAAHLKSGWETLQEIPVLSFQPTQLKEFTSLKKFHVVSLVDEHFDFLDMKDAQQLDFDFIENLIYKTGKWLCHPDHHYLCFRRHDSYIVLKQYSNFCHILDVRGDYDDVKTLLEITKTLGYRHAWNEITVWSSPHGRFNELLSACGFKQNLLEPSSIQFLTVKISSQERLSLSECNIQMGIEEMY